jgi:hypothetical protein
MSMHSLQASHDIIAFAFNFWRSCSLVPSAARAARPESPSGVRRSRSAHAPWSRVYPRVAAWRAGFRGDGEADAAFRTVAPFLFCPRKAIPIASMSYGRRAFLYAHASVRRKIVPTVRTRRQRKHRIYLGLPLQHRRRMLESRASWGGSSVGRASRSQCEGRGFDPLPLQILAYVKSPLGSPLGAVRPCAG